jgi:hypothetical protein
MNMWLHDLWRICSGKTPDNVASSVSDVCTNRMVTLVDIIDKSLVKNGNILLKPLWKKKSSSAKLGKSKTASMP